MPSKRSFFNKTLFCKNLTRFWPLWGGVSLLGSLLPLYMLLELLSRPDGSHVTPLTFSEVLYMVTSLAVPAASFGYAILCAMLVWSYLYTPRSVGLMHTLPVDRTCLFVTSTLSGLAMMLIPYAVVGVLTCLIALFFHFFSLTAVAFTILAVLLMTLTFFGIATFCAMLTGHVFALLVLYLLANFLAPLLEALLTGLTSEFLLGLPGSYQGVTMFLSPLMQLYAKLSVEAVRDAGGAISDYYLLGFGTMFLYGLVGLAALGLGYLLYRRRASESAGDVAAFRVLRPVFRGGLALLSALTLGWLLYELFWVSLHTDSMYAAPIPMAVCMALTGLLGWYVASMLLEKSLRVFHGSWKGAVVVCSGAILLCAVLSADFLDLEDKVPDLADIESVYVFDHDLDATYYTEGDPEMVEKLQSLHRALLADKETLRSEATWNGRQHYFHITYTLKDGTSLTRYYSFSVDETKLGDMNTFSGQLAALYRDPDLIVGQFAIPDGGTLSGMSVYDYVTSYGEDVSLGTGEAQALYDAIILDGQEGNIPGPPVLSNYEPNRSYDFTIDFEYRIRDNQGVANHRYSHLALYPTMTHTIDALLNLELLTPDRIADMNQTLIDRYGSEALE